MSEKYIVTDMLQIHARKLASRLMPSEQWKGIIAVSRGGLVPGALLARELGIRHVDTVCISSYDHDNQRELKVLKRAEGDGEGFIVIDDWWIPVVLRLRFVKCIQKRTLSPSLQNRLVVRWLMIMLLISRKIRIEQPWDMGVVFVPPISVANLFNARHCRALFFNFRRVTIVSSKYSGGCIHDTGKPERNPVQTPL